MLPLPPWVPKHKHSRATKRQKGERQERTKRPQDKGPFFSRVGSSSLILGVGANASLSRLEQVLLSWG